MDDPTFQQEVQWTKKKHIVPQAGISFLISSVLVGRDALLQDNPICFRVQNGKGIAETPTLTVSIALPVPQPIKEQPQKIVEGGVRSESSKVD
jgi:hypothetical protein